MADFQIIQGDCREVMRGMPEKSVHCCVTSPPYHGLRDYSLGDKGIGLEATLDAYIANIVEVFHEVRRVLRDDGTLWLNVGSSYCGGQQVGSRDISDTASRCYQDDGCPVIHLCDDCRASLLHRTGHSDVRLSLVSDVCEGVPILVHTESRVLCLGSSGSVDRIPTELSNLSKHDRQQVQARVSELLHVALESMTLQSWQPPPGACWHCANCGACLSVRGSLSRDAGACAHRMANNADTAKMISSSAYRNRDMVRSACPYPHCTTPYHDVKFKEKDLVSQPWLIALALQRDGWYLRSDIIWHKPNPMPESVTDRPTKSYEHVFLFSKRPTYYYDAEAVREPHKEPWRSGTHESNTPHIGRLDGGDQAAFTVAKRQYNPAGRNLRDVWTIPTEGYPGAHFATFPRKLVEPCIKAGTSDKGCCPKCAAPWLRIVDRDRQATRPGRDNKQDNTDMANRDRGRHVTDVRTIGWKPGCECVERYGPDPREIDFYAEIPCTVLDPMCGSGTTGVVATQLGRRFIGVDLSPSYCKLARKRIENPEPEPVLVDAPGQMGLFEGDE